MSDKGQSPLNRRIAQDSNSNILEMYAAMGSPIKAFTTDKILASSGVALTDNAIRYTAIYLPKDATITGVAFFQKVQGAFTGDQTNGLALYIYSAGTLVKVRETANDYVQVPFTTPAVLSKGLYYIAAIYNSSAGTAPQIDMTAIGTPNAAQSAPITSNSAFKTGQITGQNSFPSSQAASGVALVSGVPWFALY
jgi:hypothetical protein